MTESRPIGRWLDTVTQRNTQFGEVIWLPVLKGGLRSRIATMAGREFAVIRNRRMGRQQQWNVEIKGFVWFPDNLPPDCAAAKMGIKESPICGFPTIDKARVAVAEAHRLLEDHLRQQAA